MQREKKDSRLPGQKERCQKGYDEFGSLVSLFSSFLSVSFSLTFYSIEMKRKEKKGKEETQRTNYEESIFVPISFSLN